MRIRETVAAIVCLCLSIAAGALTAGAQEPLDTAGQSQLTGKAVDAEAAKVTIGVYVNDIQAIDLRSHSYVVDLYVWFRWKDDNLDPGKSFEFMNMFDPEAHVRTRLYEEPLPQPDGSKYILYRHQGAFSTKFPVGAYPFDSQILRVTIEDSDMGANELRYEVDHLAINPEITLPGYVIGKAELRAVDYPYSTSFGDLAEADVSAYSRAVVMIPITRPWVSGAIKTLLPVFLIILCAASALLLEDRFVEARVGLSITALLTLVALQFAASGNLPEVGYLLMLDQIFIASYAFILAALGIIVWNTDSEEMEGKLTENAASLSARFLSAGVSITLYAAVIALIIGFNLTPAR